MKPLLVALLLLAGCATSPAPEPPPLTESLKKISLGNTKAEVRAALGKTNEVAFDSGYEVWVYKQRLKEKQNPPARELVLLFDPSGVLAKTRLR